MLLGDILHAVEGMGRWKRPEILITAGITAPWASLSVQQCNHQPSTCNAQVATVSPGEGGGEAEGEEWVDAEQMDNVSSAIVLQLVMNLRLKFADWGFVFKEGLKELCHTVIREISLRNNSFVEHLLY